LVSPFLVPPPPVLVPGVRMTVFLPSVRRVVRLSFSSFKGCFLPSCGSASVTTFRRTDGLSHRDQQSSPILAPRLSGHPGQFSDNFWLGRPLGLGRKKQADVLSPPPRPHISALAISMCSLAVGQSGFSLTSPRASSRLLSPLLVSSRLLWQVTVFSTNPHSLHCVCHA
jgi:hypothetical protein